MAAIRITGDKALDKKLTNLKDNVAKKAMRKGIGAGLGVVVKGIKSEVPSQYKDAKRAIGGSFRRSRGNEFSAKAGASVGVKQKTLKKREAAQKAKRDGKGKSKGSVGIGARNIHWFILGTAQRSTGSKRTGRNSHKKGVAAARTLTGKPVHSTGRMEAIFGDIVKDGFAKSENAAIQAIRTKINEEIMREAAK